MYYPAVATPCLTMITCTQISVHDRACNAYVPYDIMGLHSRYASTEHRLREGTKTQRGTYLIIIHLSIEGHYIIIKSTFT